MYQLHGGTGYSRSAFTPSSLDSTVWFSLVINLARAFGDTEAENQLTVHTWISPLD